MAKILINILFLHQGILTIPLKLSVSAIKSKPFQEKTHFLYSVYLFHKFYLRNHIYFIFYFSFYNIYKAPVI